MNWRVVGLAVYAILLVVMGTYGYVVSTTAQPAYSSALCTPVAPGSASLPDCLPSISFSETGSALMYPMFKLWASHFIDKYPNIQINTANTGSGQGQAFVSAGQVQIGGSAAYFTDQQIQANANLLNFLNIPLAVTDTLVEYNLPNTTTTPQPHNMHLNFTATVLTEIYNTTIQFWNDPRIIAINPGAAAYLRLLNSDPKDSNLHGLGIWPYHRSDAAADTWLFTQYLSTDPWWNSTSNPGVGPGYGLSVNFPNCVANFTTNHHCYDFGPQPALGNPGIVIEAAPVTGSISYVSVEALDQWVTPLKEQRGFLQNRAGNFIDPANSTYVQAALNSLSEQTPADERISLANAPGQDSYPIVGYGYALVNKLQLNPDFAAVLRTFLTYCILPSSGSAPDLLNTYHFTPLPPAVLQLTLNQIALIGP